MHRALEKGVDPEVYETQQDETNRMITEMQEKLYAFNQTMGQMAEESAK